MTTSVRNNSVFRSFFEKQKLIGPNFIDWYRQLRLVLSTEDKENYLEHPIPAAPVALPGQQVPPEALAAHAAWVKGKKEELKAMYSTQAEQELLQTLREFYTSKQEEGKGKMGNASNNASFASKPKTPPSPKKDNPAKDAICHQCGEVGHWRRNCPVYLAELMKKKKLSQGASTSGSTEKVSERRNRTLLDMVRSMMSQTTLPKSFWDYALETAARILNMVSTTKVDKTPYEIWQGQAPKSSYLKVWGCEAFVKRDTLTKPDKLDPRSFKCIFVGYPKETMGYSFYSPSENKVFVARNAEFFESKLLDLKASGSVEDIELI
nr:zinc finger, CCHC-type [Tanacetum cinerariifolium]